MPEHSNISESNDRIVRTELESALLNTRCYFRDVPGAGRHELTGVAAAMNERGCISQFASNLSSHGMEGVYIFHIYLSGPQSKPNEIQIVGLKENHQLEVIRAFKHHYPEAHVSCVKRETLSGAYFTPAPAGNTRIEQEAAYGGIDMASHFEIKSLAPTALSPNSPQRFEKMHGCPLGIILAPGEHQVVVNLVTRNELELLYPILARQQNSEIGYFLVLAGPTPQATPILEGDEVIIGRRGLFGRELPPEVSRNHLKITRIPDRSGVFEFEDLNSRWGTGIVNYLR